MDVFLTLLGSICTGLTLPPFSPYWVWNSLLGHCPSPHWVRIQCCPLPLHSMNVFFCPLWKPSLPCPSRTRGHAHHPAHGHFSPPCRSSPHSTRAVEPHARPPSCKGFFLSPYLGSETLCQGFYPSGTPFSHQLDSKSLYWAIVATYTTQFDAHLACTHLMAVEFHFSVRKGDEGEEESNFIFHIKKNLASIFTANAFNLVHCSLYRSQCFPHLCNAYRFIPMLSCHIFTHILEVYYPVMFMISELIYSTPTPTPRNPQVVFNLHVSISATTILPVIHLKPWVISDSSFFVPFVSQ